MTPEILEHYRSICDMHDKMNDPLVMIRVDDLRILLKCFESYQTPPLRQRARPRIKAPSREMAE